MTYEELRDAGFPFSKCDAILNCQCGNKHDLPSLAELIEALGTGSFGLRRTIGYGPYEWGWKARLFGHRRVATIGATPEEAVARLWLALNQKEK